VARLVAIMDRLRSPGGCPWDGEQTHASLARYLLEETYEVLEALDTGDRVLLREELGDLLLQVVFHARIATEDPAAPFGLDDIAGDVADKLVRRHPHVFAGEPTDRADLHASWERRKRAEKQRRGVLDGIPTAIPALLLATKYLDRLAAAGAAVPEVAATGDDADVGAAVGADLLDAVVRARAAGVEPEQALRTHLAALAAAVQAV
jgi:XTP/dITP diphosphohydrolase